MHPEDPRLALALASMGPDQLSEFTELRCLAIVTDDERPREDPGEVRGRPCAVAVVRGTDGCTTYYFPQVPVDDLINEAMVADVMLR